MDWEALESFREVTRAGSFTQAARNLFLSPSTLSHRIKKLEKAWGVCLLTRTTRRVTLTDSGRALLVAVDRIEAALAEARIAITRVKSMPG